MYNSTLDKETYKKMVNLTPEILCVSYLDGRFKYVNPAFNNVFGYSNDEVKKLNIFSIIHPDDKDSLNNELLLASIEQRDIINLEYRYKCKDGTFKWVSWNVKIQLDEKLVYGAGRDVSSRKNMEHTIKDSNKKLEAIIENISDALFIFDKDGNYTTFNKSAREMYPSTFYNYGKIGDSLKDAEYYDIYGQLVTYENIPALKILRGEKLLGYRVGMKTNDDSLAYYDINGTPIYDDHGNFIAGIQCWNNVTERIEYDMILQSQYEFQNKMIDTMDLPVIRMSYPSLNITEINKKAFNIIKGLKPEMNSIDIIKGQNCSDIITDFNKERFFNNIQNIKKKKETSYIKYRKLIVSGEELLVNMLYQPIFGLKGEIEEVAVIIIDVTKEIKANCELKKNLKMQEEFFLNISHELKTPLNVIFSTTQLFDLYSKNGSLIENQDKVNKYIQVIRQNCYRQSKLVNNLIDISKIESGFFKLNLSNQNIVNIVEEIVQRHLLS